jgi:hypothetical protein
MELDIWEAIEAAKKKPFGFQAFYPDRVWAATASPAIHVTSRGRRKRVRYILDL